jgi:short-subunit dehydrogenase
VPGKLTDQVIIITGASSGIGAATALACAKAGMNVVINARRVERLQQVAQQVQSLGRGAELVPGDVTEPGISQRMLDAAINRFGRFDVVFANAGYSFEKPMVSVADDELREIFSVNFFAGVELLQKAAQQLISLNRPGHLLMCSSCLAKFTMPLHGAYCATKAAQSHICRAMRTELKKHKIQVSSVHPIGTRTEFFDVVARRSGPDGIVNSTPKAFMQSPDRVAKAVVRCLRRPKPEVWTSFGVRFSAGLMLIWPRLGDIMGAITLPRK